MSSLDALLGYGTDEFSVNSDDLNDFANASNPNYANNINIIKDRELRMMHKVNQSMPLCEYNRHQPNIDYCHKHPDMYSLKGVYDQQKRQNRRENIENHYFSGREIRVQGDCKSHQAPVQHKQTKKKKKEAFHSEPNYTQLEIMELEQKNDMLVFFIFILSIVVIVQFLKRQTPKYVHVLPLGPQYGPNTQPAPISQLT